MGLLNRILTEKINLTRSIPELKEMREGITEARVRCFATLEDTCRSSGDSDVTFWMDFNMTYFNGTLDKAQFRGTMNQSDYRKMRRCLNQNISTGLKEYAIIGTYYADSGRFDIDSIRFKNYTIFPDRVEYRKK